MTRDTAYQRAKRRLHQKLRPAFDAVRIPWFIIWAVAGIGYAIHYIQTYSWHHASLMWAVPLGFAALSLVRLYQALVAVVTVRAWMREPDEVAGARIDSVQPHTHIVPPWTRSAYLKRRQDLRRRGIADA